MGAVLLALQDALPVGGVQQVLVHVLHRRSLLLLVQQPAQHRLRVDLVLVGKGGRPGTLGVTFDFGGGRSVQATTVLV